ncbi:MAG: 1-(5-phosphoribosyl)-5-[(5-phosphoribosylamino)methylideneamino]imidazole-4-carboxamide isomerase [Candidatus Omnitrophica bacterium]|nr:1-(5-phosphoribosyl)-5-[(5-phosphoribosylamino)methylideneamino]imidazole-4-carboxamide isomerase [Candidatus Omnitrophota bacterium]
MLVIPAIDIIDGKVVRLTQGDYDKKTIYCDDPVSVAQKFKNMGAKRIHIIDLDGAKTGEPINLPIVKEIVNSTELDVELGGGIRNIQTIAQILDCGVKKVILGTAIYKDENFAKMSIDNFGEAVIFGIDAKEEKIKIEGWVKESGVEIFDCLKIFENMEVKTILYTDIAKDGMLSGPNIEMIKKILSKTSLKVIAAGGVTTIEDVRKLSKLEQKGLVGAVVGKGFYEGNIDLKEVFRAF